MALSFATGLAVHEQLAGSSLADGTDDDGRQHDGRRDMKTIDAGGVTLGVEHFGDAAAPLVLLVGGTTILSWPSALCAALARRWAPCRAI